MIWWWRGRGRISHIFIFILLPSPYPLLLFSLSLNTPKYMTPTKKKQQQDDLSYCLFRRRFRFVVVVVVVVVIVGHPHFVWGVFLFFGAPKKGVKSPNFFREIAYGTNWYLAYGIGYGRRKDAQIIARIFFLVQPTKHGAMTLINDFWLPVFLFVFSFPPLLVLVAMVCLSFLIAMNP